MPPLASPSFASSPRHHSFAILINSSPHFTSIPIFRIHSLPTLLALFLIVANPVCGEKTLCERKLAQVPGNAYYYQRTEATSATECAERCIDEWQFCRSAILVEDKGKSLCQLYGLSFERLLPLNLPPLTPAQTDPERLLPVTLVEIADPPCSSKFFLPSSTGHSVLKSIGPEARRILAMMPGPAALKKFPDHEGEEGKGAKRNEEGGRGEAEVQTGREEATSTWKDEDRPYLTPNPASKFAEPDDAEAEIKLFRQGLTSSASSSSSSFSSSGGGMAAAADAENNNFRPVPIRPAFVSHGFGQRQSSWGGGQQQPQQQRCPNGGLCLPGQSKSSSSSSNPANAASAIASYHSSQEDANNQHQQSGGGGGGGTSSSPCAAQKSTDPCAPQAHWLEWTDSGHCSVTCGVGQRQRRRYCSSGRQTDCRGEHTDTEKCVMPTCDQWTEWSEWSRCSATCGGGRRTRQRVCRNGDKCQGPSIDSRTCNEQFCPSWSEWAEWGQCSASCGRGIQRRGRECVPKEGECGGMASEFRECELRACPNWSEWEPWSSCSKSCGAGESVRHRECQDGVADDCRGPAVEHLLCNTQPCPAWSPWTEWSSCTKSCGEGSTKSRRRECRYNGLPSEECPGPEEDQTECRLGPCPHWSEWSGWSDCTTTCGHGQQSRTRKCHPNGFGCFGGDRELRFCQKAVCPYFDTWTEWGGCSVTCGRGFCERRRRCIKEGDLGKKLPAEEEGAEAAVEEGKKDNEDEDDGRKKGGRGGDDEDEDEGRKKGGREGDEDEGRKKGGRGRGGDEDEDDPRKKGGRGKGKGGNEDEDEDNANEKEENGKGRKPDEENESEQRVDRRGKSSSNSRIGSGKRGGGGGAGNEDHGANRPRIGIGTGASGSRHHSLPEDITAAAADSLLPQTLQVAQSAATVAIDRRRSPLISSKLTLRDEKRATFGKGRGGGNGGECFGPDVERKPCDAGPCCKWSGWSVWSDCRLRCGQNSGVRQRTRTCEYEDISANNEPSTSMFGGFAGQSSASSSRFGIGQSMFSNGFGQHQQQSQHCAVCIGESRQSENCAIPVDDDANNCRDAGPQQRVLGNEEVRKRPRPEETEEEEEEEGRERRNYGNLNDEGGGRRSLPMLMMRDEPKKRKEANGKEETSEVGEEDCYWTEWTGWSGCEPGTLFRNRTRMCAGLRALANNCQCQGHLLEQIPCSGPNILFEPIGQIRTASSFPPTTAAKSLLNRLQLIPRHRKSEAERQREEERKRRKDEPNGPEIEEECRGENHQWMEWGEWGECQGIGGQQNCGKGGGEEGIRSRTRECKCKRGCAGIAKETVSCQMPTC